MVGAVWLLRFAVFCLPAKDKGILMYKFKRPSAAATMTWESSKVLLGNDVILPDAKAKMLLLDNLSDAGNMVENDGETHSCAVSQLTCQKQRKNVILPALPLPGEPWTAHYPSPSASGCGTERHRLLACQQTTPSATAQFGPASEVDISI